MEKIRILYIEDDFEQRQQLTGLLRAKRFSVTSAASGQAGIKRFYKKSFDAVLCDLNMPNMDGLGVLEKIREKDRNVPFIILSSHGTVPLAEKAVKKGANYFLLKPIEIHQVALTISLSIEKAKLQKNLRDSQAVLQMVAKNVPDIIYSLNMKGEFISISPSAKSALGYDPAYFIGRSVFEIIHPDDKEWVKNSFVLSAQSGGPIVKTLQFRMITKTGKVRHFEINRKLIVENGKIIRNDGIARDITHRAVLEHKLQEYSQELINANMEMLAVQEKLKKKNSEMERVLKELSKNKEELQIIIDTSPGVIILVDQNGLIKSTNKRADVFSCFSQKILIGMSFDEFISKIKGSFEDFKKIEKLVGTLKKKPDVHGEQDITEVINRGCRLKGDRPCILAPSCFRVTDSRNRAVGHLWIFSDITSIKHADSQVHTIVNSSPIPTIISRLKDGRVLYANEELAGLVGLTARDLIGRDTPDFYYDLEDRKVVVESLSRDGYLRNFETRIKKVDGSIIWMIFSLVITEIGGEKVILGWLYDISERKKIEDALAKERNFVSAILDTAGALVVVLDTDGRIVRFNRACEQTTGYTAAEVLGKYVWDIFLIPEEVDLVKGVFKELQSGQFPNQVENYWVAKDGALRLTAWSNSALLDDEGSVEFIIGTGLDITENRRLEVERENAMESLGKSHKELKETQAQLFQSEKMASLGSLVAGIAHEINTPIGAVSSMHDTLFRTINKLREIIEVQCPEEIEQLSSLKKTFKIFDDSHKVIRSGTERVINIVRRLKSFARLDEAELKTVDIHEGLEDTLVLIHHEIKHNLDVIKNYGDIPPIACFPGQLNQVFLNLLINSKHAIKDKGIINITTVQKEDKVHIIIKDNGSGIPKENLKKIFDPGFTTKGRGVGAGLGLSICYQIIQSHRGRIKVHSELGKGTSFTIILPMNLENILENEN